MREQPIKISLSTFECYRWAISFRLEMDWSSVRMMWIRTWSNIITRLRKRLEQCIVADSPVNLPLNPWFSSEQFIYYPISHNFWIFEYYQEDVVKRNNEEWYEPHSHRCFVKLYNLVYTFYTSFKDFFCNVSEFYTYSKAHREEKTLLWKLRNEVIIDNTNPENIPYEYLKEIYDNVLFTIRTQTSRRHIFRQDTTRIGIERYWNLKEVFDKYHTDKADYDRLPKGTKLKILEEIRFNYGNFQLDESVEKFLSLKIENFLQSFEAYPSSLSIYPPKFYFSPISLNWGFLECYIGQTSWDYLHITIPTISESVETIVNRLKEIRNIWANEIRLWNSKIAITLLEDGNDFPNPSFSFIQHLDKQKKILSVSASPSQLAKSIIWWIATFMALPHFNHNKWKGYSKHETNRDFLNSQPIEFWVTSWIDKLYIYQQLNKIKNNKYLPQKNREKIIYHFYKKFEDKRW